MHQENLRDSVASDRLKKAIERNRLKQIGREKGRDNSSATRVSVARPETVEFTTPLKRDRFSSSLVEETFTFPKNTTRSQSKAQLPTSSRKQNVSIFSTKLEFEKCITLAGWIFTAIFFLRLIFAERGVVDYYRREGIIKNNLNNVANIKLNTEVIHRRIVKLNTNTAYKRKIVRDRLGFISGNEYLILFAGGQENPSI